MKSCAALEVAPAAIRVYLWFLQRHGEAVAPEGTLTTVVAEHITEGVWLGNGDPATGFGPDFQPLRAEDLNICLRRLDWLRADLLQLAHDMPRGQLVAEPEGTGRSIYRILEHVAESQGVYLRSALGKVDGLSEARRAVRQGPDDLPAALTRLWQVTCTRLEANTEAERQQTVRSTAR
jgi:hypothetical protein